ncbi:MAG: hypothetical protein K2W95_15730 [Candidatus Obscuribacterales bacterium]|nr:hypothetical protein [Candidatus Obscuribacterales bacterium]
MEVALCIKNGIDIDRARSMSAIERRAFFYTFAVMDGNEIDWVTGAIKSPESQE